VWKTLKIKRFLRGKFNLACGKLQKHLSSAFLKINYFLHFAQKTLFLIFSSGAFSSF
jgi:hypothetical protein